MNAESRVGPPVTTPAKDSPLNFEDFASQPEYVEANRELIRLIVPNLPTEFVHVDVACGTGLVIKSLIVESQGTGKKGKIIGIDPNPTSLAIARKTTQPSGSFAVEFIEGFGQNLKELVEEKIPEAGVDSVSIHDALHEVDGQENKTRVLLAMKDALKPEGLLSFNSAFTTFGMEPSPISWGRWKAAALGILGGKRDRTKESIKIYTPDDYRKMIEDVGLNVVHEAKKVVNLSKAALTGISRYPKFIEGVFSDMVGQENYPLQQKSEALIHALKNVEFISRGWYEIIAQKPPEQLLTQV